MFRFSLQQHLYAINFKTKIEYHICQLLQSGQKNIESQQIQNNTTIHPKFQSEIFQS